jgi:adenylate cyclase
MANDHEVDSFDSVWYWYLTGDDSVEFPDKYKKQLKFMRTMAHLFPGAPRCFECNAPLSGIGSKLLGAVLLKPDQFGPSSFSPRLCKSCEVEARKTQGGAEVELSMLFADIRGSTAMAQSISTTEFRQVIQRFYTVISQILVEHNGMVNRLIGDQMVGLFVPHFAGKQHARVAVETALEVQRATGHLDPSGAWVPVGIGVHTGMAYVGVVGTSDGVNEIAVLGSAANLTARLSSQAADGEVIISEAAARAAGLDLQDSQPHTLQLKGIQESVPVRTVQVRPAMAV